MVFSECIEEIIALESESAELVSLQVLIEMLDSVKNSDKFKHTNHLKDINFHELGRNLHSNPKTSQLYEKLMTTRMMNLTIYNEETRNLLHVLQKKRLKFKEPIEKGDIVQFIIGSQIEIIDHDENKKGENKYVD